MLFSKAPKILASMIEVVVERSNLFSNAAHVAEDSSEHIAGDFIPQAQWRVDQRQNDS